LILVRGEKTMRIRVGLAAIIGCAALCLALPALGQVYNMQLTAVEGVVYPGSDAYAGLYYGTASVSGGQTTATTAMICDDYNTEIPLPDSWTATALTAPEIAANLSSTKFGANFGSQSAALTAYAEIATLVELMFAPGETAAYHADISGAIWSIADQGTGPIPLDTESNALIAWAKGYVGSNAASVLAADTNLKLYTPTPLSSSQEFWFDPEGTSINIPEGGAGLLYLLLAGLTCFGAMYFSPKNQFGNRVA
jgi:hypothetical protein